MPLRLLRLLLLLLLLLLQPPKGLRFFVDRVAFDPINFINAPDLCASQPLSVTRKTNERASIFILSENQLLIVQISSAGVQKLEKGIREEGERNAMFIRMYRNSSFLAVLCIGILFFCRSCRDTKLNRESASDNDGSYRAIWEVPRRKFRTNAKT
ncbi:hypothetical protein CAPTEDRAFT_209263 [Capitella teleta]|uniref:Uncharacterized protein n=1 Tax=Capitella teleta TaxID=283909 RepID=R7U715_CAPTE|nr:hypothetical protein CAPTEDRAFT_209263 [Capitella teleta]|eukprot:ELU02160.1 hypothetical protein CAPTEDRAFT_209263 [Capitella teleta]